MKLRKGQRTYRLPERGGTVLNVMMVSGPHWVLMQPGKDWVQHKFDRDIHFFPTPRKALEVRIEYQPPRRVL